MITKVVMPKLSEAMETGKVIKWLKKEGDRIKGGDIIAEIETDKANVEIEAFGAGVLRKILVRAGGTVPVGELIGVIAEPGEDIAALVGRAGGAAPAARGRAGGPPPAPAPAAAPAGRRARLRRPPAATPVVPARRRWRPSAAAGAPRAGRRVKASPLARKIAAQSGVDSG